MIESFQHFPAWRTTPTRRRSRLRTCRVLLVIVCVGVGVVPKAVACDILARTADFVVTDCDLERWRPVLETRKDLRKKLREGDAIDTLLEEIALARILVAEYAPLVSAAEVIAMWEQQQARRVISTYVAEVVESQIEISDQEVQSAYQQWRATYRTSDSAVVHEIFRWGPRDLPEYRGQQRELLERLRSGIHDFEGFKKAAAAHSDSTSALANGSLGHLRRSSLTKDLESILFDGALGVSEMVETRDGLYLFYVSSRQPARNRFEDVADELVSHIRRKRLAELGEEDFARLSRRYDLVLHSAEQCGRDGVAFTLQGRPIRLVGGVQPESDTDSVEDRIARQARATLYSSELESLGLCPADDRVEEIEDLLARQIFKRLVTREWSVRDRRALEAEARAAIVNPRRFERWTFGVLTVDSTNHPRFFFDVMRLCHDMGVSASLESTAQAVESRLAVATELEMYDDVPMQDVAGLGPEIYNTVRYRLSPGEMSRPLVLDGGERLVLVRLETRRDDEEAARIALNSRATREARLNLAVRLRQELLDAHLYSVAR